MLVIKDAIALIMTSMLKAIVRSKIGFIESFEQ